MLHASRSWRCGRAEAGGRQIELLLRMRDENGSIVQPPVFMPAAERYNLMPTSTDGSCAGLPAPCGRPDHRVGSVPSHQPLETNQRRAVPELRHGQIGHLPCRPGELCFEMTETAAITQLRRGDALHLELRGRAASSRSTISAAVCHRSVPQEPAGGRPQDRWALRADTWRRTSSTAAWSRPSPRSAARWASQPSPSAWNPPRC